MSDKYRSVEHQSRSIMELSSRDLSAGHRESAKRIAERLAAAKEKAEESKKEKEAEIAARTRKAEKLKEGSLNMDNEKEVDEAKRTLPSVFLRLAKNKKKHVKEYGSMTEAKKFVFDKPQPALVKIYDKRETDDLKGMHKRYSSDHSSSKNNPDTSDKFLAVHHVLKNRGENMGELPKHKNLGLTMHEETNTEKRMKIKSVARMDDPEPTSDKSTLNKTDQIKTKIVEDKPTLSLPNFGLSVSLINATRQIVEKKHDERADEKKMTGGKTVVDINPETDERSDDSHEEMKKESKHTIPKTDKEKKLAALAHPKDKITHKDVLVGRGVLAKEEVEFSDNELEHIQSIMGKEGLDEGRGRPPKSGKEAEGDDTHKHPIQQLTKISLAIQGSEPHFEHKDGSKSKITKQTAGAIISAYKTMRTSQEKDNFANKLHASRDSMNNAIEKHVS